MEWHIDNFSCWNAEVHGQKISCPRVLSGLPSELLPKGSGGRLEARLFGGRAGDLFFLGPDGSPICSSLMVSGGGELPPGPTFDEVVARIKKTTGDRLTVRFQCADDDVRKQHLRTVIEVFETSLEVNPKKMGGGQDVSCFDFPGNKKVKSFSLSHNEEDRFELTPSSIKGSLVTTNVGLFDSKILVRSCVQVLDRAGCLVSYDERELIFRDRTPWVFSDALNMSELAEKGFTLLLKFKVIPGSVSRGLCHLPFTRVGVDTTPGPENALSKDLLYLYQDQDFCDFELNCGGVSFPTHRAVLGGRSPVFKRMLLSDMEEAKRGEADIKDLDPSTLALFLTFLYTGAVDDLQVESALQLYYTADKYQVPTLKRECAKTLCADLSLSNVCDVLSLAEIYDDCRVASAARRFIVDNYDDVLASDEWKCLVEHDPSLAVKTRAFCNQRKCDGGKNRKGVRKNP